jgi:hypothetical protein
MVSRCTALSHFVGQISDQKAGVKLRGFRGHLEIAGSGGPDNPSRKAAFAS